MDDETIKKNQDQLDNGCFWDREWDGFLENPTEGLDHGQQSKSRRQPH